MKKLIPVLSIVLIFSSCTTTIYMTKTVEPELILDPQPARIVFSNQFDYLSNPGIKDKHEIAYETGIDRFAETLANGTVQENPMVIFLVDTIGGAPNADRLFEKFMSKDEIGIRCRAHDAAFLLSLDSLRIHFEWETIRDENSDGLVSKEKFFYLFSNYYVSLYDSAGGLSKRTLLEKSLLYTSRPTLSGLITIQPNLAKAQDKIEKLAKSAALEYVYMFYPSVVNEGRTLYGGKFFEETNMLIKQWECDKAIVLLSEMTHSPNRKLAVRAQHNLAIARELKQYHEENK